MTKGQRIRKAREKAHFSQTDLAKIIGISKQTLYKYEHDIVTNIPSNIVELIADLTFCTPAYIMGWDEPETFATPEEFELRWHQIGGGRHPLSLSDDEQELVLEYRVASDDDKRMVRRMLAYATKMKGGDSDVKS